MQLPYSSFIEFKPINPPKLDPSQPNMGLSNLNRAIDCEVVAVGVKDKAGPVSINDAQAEAAGTWPLRVGDGFSCKPSGIWVNPGEVPVGGGQALPSRYYVERKDIVSVDPR